MDRRTGPALARALRASLGPLALAALLIASAGVLSSQPAAQPGPLGFSFTNVAREAGLNARTVYGGQDTNTYLVETTGTGAAALDYDDDGWVDIFLVNGSVLEGFPKGAAPTNHLYRNKGNGTFEDVTERAGLAQSGWGQAACAADYDNDGRADLFVTYLGSESPLSKRRQWHVRGCDRTRWSHAYADAVE